MKGISLSGFNSCREMLTEVIVARNGKYILGEMDTSKALSTGTRRKVRFQFIKVSRGHTPLPPVALAPKQERQKHSLQSCKCFVALISFQKKARV